MGCEVIEEFSTAKEYGANEIGRFLESAGMPDRTESLASHQIVAAFTAVRETLFPDMPAEFLQLYAEAALQITAIERAGTSGLFELEPEIAVEKAVLGIALFEPILVGLRRLAHEKYVAAELSDGANLPGVPHDVVVQIPRPTGA